MFDTIVVGTDGSTTAQHAFGFAAAIARANQARLVAVHVVEVVGGKGGQYPVHIDEEDLEARLRRSVDELKGEGVVAELVIERIITGGPAHVLAEVAADVHADVIVVGNRGHTPVSDLLLGNVPTRLLHIAHRPVLVVPVEGE
jgi:nucleotide-binding universal stress UspA family protein